jgi:hypothetical protein
LISITLLFLLLLALPVHAQQQPCAGTDSGTWGVPVEEQPSFTSDSDESLALLEEHQYQPSNYSEAVQEFVAGRAGNESGDSATMLREILSSPAFKSSIQPDIQGETLLEKLGRWLNNTMAKIGTALGLGSSTGGTVIIYVMVVLALALMAMLIRQLIMSSGTRRGRRHQEAVVEPESIPDLLRLAERHAADGEFRQALRYRYLATLQSLDLPSSTLTTNSMLIRELQTVQPQLLREFRSLVALFEDAWYGSMETGRTHYQEAATLAGSLDSQIAIRHEEQS